MASGMLKSSESRHFLIMNQAHAASGLKPVAYGQQAVFLDIEGNYWDLLAFADGDCMHGKICYLEIPARTAEASADFYSTIFDWKVRKRGDGALAFDDTTGGVSGTWVKESDRTPDERTRTYIMVDDISATLKRIEAGGGRVLTPRTDIGSGMGAFAAFADPVGNEFGLYEEPGS